MHDLSSPESNLALRIELGHVVVIEWSLINILVDVASSQVGGCLIIMGLGHRGRRIVRSRHRGVEHRRFGRHHGGLERLDGNETARCRDRSLLVDGNETARWRARSLLDDDTFLGYCVRMISVLDMAIQCLWQVVGRELSIFIEFLLMEFLLIEFLLLEFLLIGGNDGGGEGVLDGRMLQDFGGDVLDGRMLQDFGGEAGHDVNCRSDCRSDNVMQIGTGES